MAGFEHFLGFCGEGFKIKIKLRHQAQRVNHLLPRRIADDKFVT